MQAAGDGVGRAPQRGQIVRFQKRDPFGDAQPPAGDRFIEDIT